MADHDARTPGPEVPRVHPDVDRAAYWRDGAITGIPVLTAEEARGFGEALLDGLAAQEAAHGGVWADRDHYPWTTPDHPLRSLYRELLTHPRLLDAVETVLGPDLLVRNGDVFLKAPGVPRGVSWHLDTARRDGTEDGMLTAWLGLGADPVDGLSGGLVFARGAHRAVLPGGPTDKADLDLSPRARSALQAYPTLQTRMPAGHASLHHACMPHTSRFNWSTTPRLGFVVRFLAPWCSVEMAESGVAMLVRGEDRVGNFRLLDDAPVTWSHQVPPGSGRVRDALTLARRVRREGRRAAAWWRRWLSG